MERSVAESLVAERSAGECSVAECSVAERQLNVAVLGVGLIGGSIGLAVRARGGAQVTGWDADPSAGSRARAHGAIDRDAARISDAVRDADVVFVAVPVGALTSTVQAALAAAGPETIVTDVGSTKQAVAQAISDPRFIPGHPLAGAELAGVEHARKDLFEGATWFLCGEHASSAARERLRELVASFGARPVQIDPETHDRLMAGVSQLPHVLANLLVAQAAGLVVEAAEEGDEGLPGSAAAGPSFRDATRVAGSNSAIWTDIYMSNRQALAAAIDELIPRLQQVRALLAEGDAEALTAWNERARAWREALLPGAAAEGTDRR